MPVHISVPDEIEFTRPARSVAAPAQLPAYLDPNSRFRVAPVSRDDDFDEAPGRREPKDPKALNRAMRAAAERRRRQIINDAIIDRAETAEVKRARELEKQGIKVDGADKGTAPTRAKMKPDTLLSMLDRGQLSQEAYDAALSIRAAYMLITVGMDARIATYGESFGGIGDTWEAAWAVQMQELYNDWCDVMAERAAAAQKVRRGTRRWQTKLVLDLVIDGMTCTEISEQNGMCKNVVADMVRDALELHVQIKAGKVKAISKMAA